MISKATGSGERVSTYEIADNEMAAGSTFGAPKGALVLKGNGPIERFYAIDAGASLIGTVQIAYWDRDTGVFLGAMPGKFIIHPECQEHLFDLSNELTVHERIFLLNSQPRVDRADPLVAYYHIDIENPTNRTIDIASLAVADMRGNTSGELHARFIPELQAFVAFNRAQPEFARAFRSSLRPHGWEATSDHGRTTRTTFPGPLANVARAKNNACFALFEHVHRLRPRSKTRLTLVLAAASNGTRELRKIVENAPSMSEALERTRERYHAILGRAMVLTPDSIVNRGVLWAKANMLRTQLLAPTGWCFVNDPTRSNNSVARDTSWFAFGSDYVTPDFSRESLLWYANHLERRGMAVEFYDIRNGRSADYGLNINDNTPLVILALWHHANASGNEAFLREVYPKARKAANYILSQRNEQGLVWCTATGTKERGIVGWRNVISGYRISGASTELNSECFAALQAVGKMAARLGKNADAAHFARAARALRDAINEHLYDPETGLYYLTIDVDGVPRTEVSCDLVFPVMFGVADPDRAAHIVSRLSMEPFWTGAGIRTVPRDDVAYGPTHGYGLLGGVWVGVTFWYAFAAARFDPGFMASALRESFEHYSRDPRRNNTVPGQFSEWLNGETLVNQGMMLSPWFPPRYLWAAIEGAAGLDLSNGEPSCNPRLAPAWRWLGVCNVRFRQGSISWFVVRAPEVKMYATFRFKSELKYHAYDEDATNTLLDLSSSDVTGIVLRREGELVIFVGNTSDRTISTSVRLRHAENASYAARMFSSIRGEWVERKLRGRDLLRGLALHLDREGFEVIELRRNA